MKKTLQIWIILVLFLFLFPVIINYLPDGGAGAATTTKLILKEPSQIVYAENITEEDIPEIITLTPTPKALLYFTHSHEAYEPVTKAKSGKVAVSHQSENIMKFGEKLKTQLIFNGIETDILPIDNQLEMQKNGIAYGRSYKEIRPHVAKQIQEENYDLVIDLHRDHLGPDRTTVVFEDENYAKIAFVVGMDHPNYAQNKAMAQQMKDELELLVPGITRHLIMKGGARVDGKYNQDLGTSFLLIELGGIGNSEDELNRTISVIAKAASKVVD